jgi:hypothetical protein
MEYHLQNMIHKDQYQILHLIQFLLNHFQTFSFSLSDFVEIIKLEELLLEM